MAKLKIKTGAGLNDWTQVFPETLVDQITDSTPLGKAIVKSTGTGYLRVTAEGEVSYVTGETLRGDVGAAPASHNHSIAQINLGGVTLQAALNDKANLVGGTVPLSELPASVLGGLKYAGSFSSSQTLGTGMFNLSQSESDWGKYWVSTADNVSIAVPVGWVFENNDDNLDGGTNPIADIVLEKGDWIVYKEHDGSNFIMGIVNNKYPIAAAGAYGVVRLSSYAGTSRAGLSDTSSGERVINESVLKNVMKDVHYGGSPAGELGDIWIDTTP